MKAASTIRETTPSTRTSPKRICLLPNPSNSPRTDSWLIGRKSMYPKSNRGKKILIAAHGNTLRALVKHLDNISEEVIPGLNIPTGVPLVYELDEDLKPIAHPDAIGPLSGHYLGDQQDIRNRIGAVLAQTK
mmetsp:Transcript_15167/g.25706  ORF Transcript_15167/g.25706 Transcript_15167/m.25706 type:complete len:132 (+) Transcript_15167:259-654(+)